MSASHCPTRPSCTTRCRHCTRTQRSAEALDLFDRVRREYADAYGLDLSRQLAEAQVEILRDQHVADAPGPIETPGPNQLPRAATDFVGRSADLETLDRLFDEAHGRLGRPGTVPHPAPAVGRRPGRHRPSAVSHG